MSAEIHKSSQLRDLRLALLRLHKVLLDIERAAYEKAHGRVSSGEMLQLVINGEHFAWLHAISELIVKMDEMFDAKEPLTADVAESLFAETERLLKPSQTGNTFQKKYDSMLQNNAEALVEHRKVAQILSR
jgi:hypothetical protein